MATEVGTAYVSVVPEAKGFAQKLQKDIDPAATTAGKSAGSKFGTGFAPETKGFSQKLQKSTDSAAMTAGKTAGSKFGSGFTPETKDFPQKLTKATEPAAVTAGKASGRKFGAGFQSTVVPMLAAFGVMGVVSKAMDEAEDAAQTTAKLGTTLKNLGLDSVTEQITDYSKALGEKIAVDDDDIAKVQIKIAAFGQLGQSVQESADIINQLTEASYNLAATQGGSAETASAKLAKIMADPSKATGLARMGVPPETIQSIKDLAAAGKIEEAQNLILISLRDRLAGAAEANKTASQQLSVVWGDVTQKIGEGLLPLMTLLANVLQVIPIPVLVAGVTALALAVGAALVIPLISATAAVWGFTAALLANPITWIIIAIIALVAAIWLLWQNWDTVKNALSAAWDWIKEKFTLFAGQFKGTWAALWEAVKQKASEIWNGIKGAIQTGINAVKNVITTVLNTIKNIWDSTFGALARGVSAAFSKAKSAVESVVKWIGDKVKWALAQIAKLPGGSIITGMLGFAAGGPVPGDGPIYAHRGEYVLNPQMTAQAGIGRLEQWRQSSAMPQAGGGTNYSVTVNNPLAESASESLPRVMRGLAYVGIGS